MSDESWDTRRDGDPMWVNLDDLGNLLKGVGRPDTVNDRDALHRLTWIVETLRAHREEPGRAYTPTMLDNVNRQLVNNVLPPLRVYVTSPEGNSPSLQSAASLVDTIVDAMAGWPPLTPKGAAQAAGKASAAREEAAERALAELERRVGAASEAAANVGERVDATRSAYDQLLHSVKEDAESEVQAVVTQVIQGNQTNLDESVAKFQAAMDDVEAKNQDVRLLTTETRNIVAAFARRAVAEDYGTNARNKSAAGWVWDGLGVLVGGTALAILLWHFFHPAEGQSATNDNGVALALTRVAISGGAIGLAFLCFRRGGENHREARRSKRAEIRLRTADTFLANQSDVVREAVLQGMAERIYLLGQLDEDPTPEDTRLPGYIAQVLARRAASRDEQRPGEVPPV